MYIYIYRYSYTHWLTGKARINQNCRKPSAACHKQAKKCTKRAANTHSHPYKPYKEVYF